MRPTVEFKVFVLTVAPDEFDPLPDASRPFAQSLLVARPSSTLMISRGSCVQSVRFVKHKNTHRKRDKDRDTPFVGALDLGSKRQSNITGTGAR